MVKLRFVADFPGAIVVRFPTNIGGGLVKLVN